MIIGVTLAQGNGVAFKAAFISAMAAANGVLQSAVVITTITTINNRRLGESLEGQTEDRVLTTASSLKIGYTITSPDSISTVTTNIANSAIALTNSLNVVGSNNGFTASVGGAAVDSTTSSPSASPVVFYTNNGGCFSGSETVTLESGDVKFIADVVVGDRVLAADSDGQTIFSDVVFVPHGSNKQSAIFTQISTEDGRDVKMTHNHILPAGVCGNNLSLVYASKVTVGDCIQTASGQERVSKIDFVRREGLYTIVTKEEYIVVNGIVASSFAVNHMMANLYYNMHRIIYSLSPVLLASKMVHSLNEGMGMFIPLFGSV